MRQRGELGRKTAQFFQMKGREPFQLPRSFRREFETDNTPIVGGPTPLDESLGVSSIDQLDSAVMSEHQVVRDFADRWTALV
jgi:hypothetical protein